MVTVSEITVSWPSYQAPTVYAGTQSPGITVSSYDVEMTTSDQDWTVVGSETAVSRGRTYSHRVGQLVPGTRYRFRLVIVWLNDRKPTRSVPGPPTRWILTHCGQCSIPSLCNQSLNMMSYHRGPHSYTSTPNVHVGGSIGYNYKPAQAYRGFYSGKPSLQTI